MENQFPLRLIKEEQESSEKLLELIFCGCLVPNQYPQKKKQCCMNRKQNKKI